MIAIQREVAAADVDLSEIVELICTGTQTLIGCSGATILMRDGHEFVHRATSGFVADLHGQRLGIDDTFSGWVYRQDRPAICNDTRQLPNPLALARGIRAMLAVPLRPAGAPVGILSVLSEQPDVFGTEDLEALELLSVVLSAAISNASEREARRAEAAQVIARLEAANVFSAPIVTAVEPAGEFWRAEEYHQNYFANHPRQPYCLLAVAPKVAKVRAQYAHRIEPSG